MLLLNHPIGLTFSGVFFFQVKRKVSTGSNSSSKSDIPKSARREKRTGSVADLAETTALGPGWDAVYKDFEWNLKSDPTASTPAVDDSVEILPLHAPDLPVRTRFPLYEPSENLIVSADPPKYPCLTSFLLKFHLGLFCRHVGPLSIFGSQFPGCHLLPCLPALAPDSTP